VTKTAVGIGGHSSLDPLNLIRGFVSLDCFQRYSSMPADHDLISKPTKDRYFPLTHARVLKLVRQAGFRAPESGKRIRLNYVNAAGNPKYGQLLVAFQPRRSLTVYSIGEEAADAWGIFCLLLALEKFLELDAAYSDLTSSTRNSFHQIQTTHFEFYSNYGERLTLREVNFSGAVSKYRAGTKFAHAFKPCWKLSSECVLEEYDCRQKRQALMAEAIARMQLDQPLVHSWKGLL